MGLDLRQRWQALRERTKFPRLNLVIELLQDLLTVSVVNAAVIAFAWFGHWLAGKVPVGAASESHSYLPFDHVRVILTVIYLVSMLSIAASGVMTLVKIVGPMVVELRAWWRS